MTPEGRVKAKVKKALKSLNGDCWHFMPVQTGYGSPALDYLACIKGRFVAIETKAPGKKLTPLQESTKVAMEAAGGTVLVIWDDASLAEGMKVIRHLGHDNGRDDGEREAEAGIAAYAGKRPQEHLRTLH